MKKQKERYLTSLAGLVIGLSTAGAQAYTLTQSEVNADEAAIIAARRRGCNWSGMRFARWIMQRLKPLRSAQAAIRIMSSG